MAGARAAEKKVISSRRAQIEHGISANHEVMPNGEFRFRLTPSDGNGYIRTVCGTGGAWQNAHYHQHLRETYIVERGWIASAEQRDGRLVVSRHGAGRIFTTEPGRAHNIYLSAGSVIHTVKHGGIGPDDWHPDDALTERTKELTEDDMSMPSSDVADGDRFGSYVDLYNNLDRLLWTVPNLLAAGATIIIGFFASIVSRSSTGDIHPAVYSAIFLFCAVLYYLGYVSMTRLREHHSMVGTHLASMEPDGYFKQRLNTVARRWPIAAPNQFRIVYGLLALALFSAAVGSLIWPPNLIQN